MGLRGAGRGHVAIYYGDYGHSKLSHGVLIKYRLSASTLPACHRQMGTASPYLDSRIMIDLEYGEGK